MCRIVIYILTMYVYNRLNMNREEIKSLYVNNINYVGVNRTPIDIIV